MARIVPHRPRTRITPATRTPGAQEPFVLTSFENAATVYRPEFAILAMRTAAGRSLLRRLHTLQQQRGLSHSSVYVYGRAIANLLKAASQDEFQIDAETELNMLPADVFRRGQALAAACTAGDQAAVQRLYFDKLKNLLKLDEPLAPVDLRQVQLFETSSGSLLEGPLIKRPGGVSDAYSIEQSHALEVQCIEEINALLRSSSRHISDGCRDLFERCQTYPQRARQLSEIDKELLREAGHSLQQLQSAIYCTLTQLLPFFVLIALRTGLEPECISGLRRDCLSNRAGGKVTVEYVKNRSPGSEAKRLQVDDNGHMSAGWLLREVLKRTEAAHKHLPVDYLWIVYSPRGPAPTQRPSSGDGLLRVPRFGSTGPTQYDAGAKLVLRATERTGIPIFALDTRRLRKTAKRASYRSVAGDMNDFTVNHSVQTAAKFYADLPSNRSFHDEAIHRGLSAGWEDAMREPTVLTGEPSEHSEGTPGRGTRKLLWTNDCTDFQNSPFGVPGEDCRAMSGECLTCPNAVVTRDHLPNIHRFIDTAREQAGVLPYRDWSPAFALPVAVAQEKIFPRFSMREVAAARQITNAGQAAIYLPPTGATGSELT